MESALTAERERDWSEEISRHEVEKCSHNSILQEIRKKPWAENVDEHRERERERESSKARQPKQVTEMLITKNNRRLVFLTLTNKPVSDFKNLAATCEL